MIRGQYYRKNYSVDRPLVCIFNYRQLVWYLFSTNCYFYLLQWIFDCHGSAFKFEALVRPGMSLLHHLTVVKMARARCQSLVSVCIVHHSATGATTSTSLQHSRTATQLTSIPSTLPQKKCYIVKESYVIRQHRYHDASFACPLVFCNARVAAYQCGIEVKVIGLPQVAA